MKTRTAFFKTLEGTGYEIGKELGNWVLSRKEWLNILLLPPDSFPEKKVKEIIPILDKHCPGINEEIQGFADTVKTDLSRIAFYASSYLEHGCNVMSMLPGKSENGHTLMARTWDFKDDMDEMCFIQTKVAGKYSHVSSMCNFFGRSDGMNEHRLAVSVASNGFPVGNLEGMQKPGVTGIDLCSVIRSVLENCINVEEAVEYLMMADKSNTIALFECINGHNAYKLPEDRDEETFLSVSNHTVFPELKQYEKAVLKNSVIREDIIKKTFESREKISCDDIKQLLSTSYPGGLCCHYYAEFFGSLRPMIFDVTEGTIEMTYGSPQHNEWRKLSLADIYDDSMTVNLPQEAAPAGFRDME